MFKFETRRGKNKNTLYRTLRICFFFFTFLFSIEVVNVNKLFYEFIFKCQVRFALSLNLSNIETKIPIHIKTIALRNIQPYADSRIV